MATLTETAITARKLIRYTFYFVIMVVVARFLFGVGVSLFQQLFPAGPPPPTVGFGLLPPLPFPEQQRTLPELSYTLETPTGGLPAFPEQLPVYFMPRNSIDLFTEDRARERASKMGYTTAPLELSDTIWRFNHPGAPATMQTNVVSKVYSVSYNLAFDPSPIAARVPTPSAATSAVQSFFGLAEPFPGDLTGRVQHDFLRVEGQNLVSAISLSEANFIKVNFFRSDINELPAVTPNPSESNVWAIVSGSSGVGQIVSAEFKYYPMDTTQPQTYPLREPAKVYEELLNGGGYIANLGTNIDGNIVIRRVYMAYYDPGVQYNFYQPVVVFEGDNDFVAYVPAVSPEFYSE